MAAPGVVEIGDAVAEPGSEMEQHRCWRVAHACVAVGGAGGDTLEEREHAAHLRNGVERRDEMHLRRSRIPEDDVDAGADETAEHRFPADHCARTAGDTSKSTPGLRMPSGSNAALIRPMSASFAGSSSARK